MENPVPHPVHKLLENRRAVVTGASRGLGLAIARALAVDGASVLCAGRSEELAAKAAAGVREAGGTAAHIAVDLADPESADRIVNAALEELGGVDVLVNNAGVFVWKGFLDIDREDFDRTIAVNLAAPFHLAQRVARVMIKQGEGGSIINVASIHGKVADPNVVAHCASKFGLIGLTKSMADALREHRIRVNAICPGSIEPDSAGRRSTSPREKVTQGDVATLAVFLASDLAHAITGAAIDMPGSTRVEIKA